MFYGARSCAPWSVGFVVGLSICALLSTTSLPPILPSSLARYSLCRGIESVRAEQYVDNAGPWKVNVLHGGASRVNGNANDVAAESKQIIRPRFAVTELGIREKLMVIILGKSSLGPALNVSISKYLPRVHLFLEESRIDQETVVVGENLSPFRANGQQAHVHILNTIFNKSMHENFDWFLIVPDQTYVNPFRLLDFVGHHSFHEAKVYGVPEKDGTCAFSGGILLSNPVLRSLVQQRQLCASIPESSYEKALEICIHRATNVTCSKDVAFNWWRTDDAESGTPLHDHIPAFASQRGFNESMTVSDVLSEMDVMALQNHFVDVEVSRLSREIDELSEVLEETVNSLPGAKTWPRAMPPVSKSPNRFQVPFWEYFTETEIFKIENHENVHPLVGNDALDVQEVVGAARALVEAKHPSLDFLRLRNGYRVFNAQRGMEYVVDLEYRSSASGVENKRVVLCRPIHVSQLVPHVPYVKEDTDVTLVLPVGSPDQVIPARSLLVRHLKMCKASMSQSDSRRTRLVVAIRGISALNGRQLSNDLVELKKRCESMQMETALLLLKPNSNLMVEMEALDEAIDHFGAQTVYTLLSPFADYQREFLDRIRINAIRRFQVFMPIPFAEYSPKVVTADQVLQAKADPTMAKQVPEEILKAPLGERIQKLNDLTNPVPEFTRPIIVHKNNGLFDTNDFSVIAMFGTDYLGFRDRFLQRLNEGDTALDLSAMFLGQEDVHVLRAIEPSLKMRYHLRTCPAVLSPTDFMRCSQTQRLVVGSKAQLANVAFSDMEDVSEA